MLPVIAATCVFWGLCALQIFIGGKPVSAGDQPVKWGRVQNVFELSGMPGHLLKLPRNGGFVRRFLGVRLKPKADMSHVRQVHLRYIDVTRRAAERHARGRPGRIPVASAYETVETSAGPGILVERLNGADGSLAPTLYDWVAENGVDDAVLAALNRLAAEVRRLDLILGDLRPRNVVVVENAGSIELVVVDGVGESEVAGMRARFPALNLGFLSIRFQRLSEHLDLKWRPLRWRFERT